LIGIRTQNLGVGLSRVRFRVNLTRSSILPALLAADTKFPLTKIMNPILAALFLLSFFHDASVVAYPTFTGSCNAGNSLGDPHTKAATSGALSALGLQLKIGGKALTPGSTFTVKAGASLAISLASTGGKKFRGFQIRLSQGSTDTSTWLGAGKDKFVQVDKFCTMSKVGGISHKENSDKTSVAGTLKVPSATTGITIEVTIVVNDRPSIWYKSDYKVVAK
jgi:Reeler domain